MNFSGIYQEEQFYEGEQISWIDLSDISGTNCYCDGDAQAQILERMEKYPVSGIYFIDSGNYHYMSRIGIGRVKEPFNLLVFDNHTDMQLPAFGGLLSCGGRMRKRMGRWKNPLRTECIFCPGRGWLRQGRIWLRKKVLRKN